MKTSARSKGIAAVVGLGGVLLLWAALGTRGERAQQAPPAPRKSPARPGTPPGAAPRTAAPTGEAALRGVHDAPSVGEGDYPVIEGRLRKLEERLAALEAKRAALSGANQDLERKIAEKSAEASARMMAEFRVAALERLLGLGGDQKQALLDLWTKWMKEDAGRTASRDAWLAREGDLRACLSVEQASRLHQSASAQSQQLWSSLAPTIGHIIGASADDQVQLQQALGVYREPTSMLLPEGYGADWPGMMKEASGRLRASLSAEQVAKLDRFVPH